MITEAGVYDLTAEQYHADPVPGGSLSSTGARRLLSPSCPALYRYERDNPRTTSSTFNLGHAAHRLVLGAGPELVEVGPDYKTKAARATRDEAWEAGDVPLRSGEYEQVQEMARALREHPWAADLFKPGTGTPEQALIWQDKQTGVWCRALLDWLRNPGVGPRLIVADYKSAVAADPDSIQRAMDRYGYHQQAAWYLAGVRALGLAGEIDPAFVFVFQEKSAPYLVTVAEPDAMALRIGAALNRQAIEVYAECTRTGRWPGYSDDVVLTPLPAWAENRYLQEMSS